MPPKNKKKKKIEDDLWDEEEPKELYSEYGYDEDSYESIHDY